MRRIARGFVGGPQISASRASGAVPPARRRAAQAGEVVPVVGCGQRSPARADGEGAGRLRPRFGVLLAYSYQNTRSARSTRSKRRFSLCSGLFCLERSWCCAPVPPVPFHPVHARNGPGPQSLRQCCRAHGSTPAAGLTVKTRVLLPLIHRESCRSPRALAARTIPACSKCASARL